MSGGIQDFFSTRLPRALVASPGFAGAKGTLAIIVEGAGSWTVRFGDTETPVIEDADAESDCIAVWMEPAFAALLKGNRDLDTIRPSAVVGDVHLLARLGSHLQPTQKGGVGARLAALAA